MIYYKYRYYYIFIFILAFGWSTSMYGQIWLSNEEIYYEAEEFLDAEEYVEALPLYNLLEKKGLLNANLEYKIGECYLNIPGKKFLSLSYLKSAASKASSKYVNIPDTDIAPLRSILLLGVSYRINREYAAAIQTFTILKDSVQLTDPDFTQVIDMHIRRCENAKLLEIQTSDILLSPLDEVINSNASNFNPVMINDETLFYMNEMKFYDALLSSENVDGDWQDPINLTPKIGSDGDHVLTDVSADGTKLLLSMFVSQKGSEIFEVSFIDNKWQEITPIKGAVNTPSNETHASYSNDGKSIYFTSNRPGGHGGTDIYSANLLENGEWGEVKNLGKKINTPFNEETPFLTDDGNKLFFSSQGHFNAGGYDFYYATKDSDGVWSRPENLGMPLSSTDDDLFFYPLGNGENGLVSKLENSESTSYDLYKVDYVLDNVRPTYLVKGSFQLPDSLMGQSVYIKVSDKNTNKELYSGNSSPDGNFIYLLPVGDYVFKFDHKDLMEIEKSLSISKNSPHESFLLVDAMQDITADSTSAIPVAEIQIFILKDVLFAFDSYRLLESESAFLISLVTFMNAFPTASVKVIGHTDAVGPAAYNLSLSKQRASTVKQFLINKGINPKAISIAGKGEASPVAKNYNVDGTINKLGQKFNRRVSFDIENVPSGVKIEFSNNVPDDIRNVEK